jgi:hypothetical protein
MAPEVDTLIEGGDDEEPEEGSIMITASPSNGPQAGRAQRGRNGRTSKSARTKPRWA